MGLTAGVVAPMLAAVCAAIAVWVAVPGDAPRGRVLGVLLPPGTTLARAPAARSWWSAALEGWRRHRLHRQAAARANTVADVCAAVAAELDAGRGVEEALRAGVAWAPEPCPTGLRLAVRAVEAGGDVIAALRRGAEEPGAEALVAMAACWSVSRSSGAGLAAALGRLAQALRAEQEHRREVAAQLAGPRATARILFVLPAFGLLLGRLLGAHPVQTLVGSPLGLLAAATGICLDVAGLVWTSRLVRTAQAVA